MTDNKYTDEEIIKALNICTQQNSSIPCCDCPCWDDDEQDCEVIDDTVILDIINRQKAEIEKLKSNYSKLCKYTEKKELELAEINADISWFREAKISRLAPAIKEIKAEAYAEACKEFADKLKKKCYEDFEETNEMLAPYVTEDNIDNILKEMMDKE